MAISLYTLFRPHTGIIPGANMPPQVFLSQKGELLFSVAGDKYVIEPGYSWDGCTPKKRIFGKVFGVSDGPLYNHTYRGSSYWKPQLYLASCTHDAFAQFTPKGITRKRIDANFQADMIDVGWKWHQAYYHAVRAWSKLKGYK